MTSSEEACSSSLGLCLSADGVGYQFTLLHQYVPFWLNKSVSAMYLSMCFLRFHSVNTKPS